MATAVIATVIGYVAYLGASSSWRYYVHVDECVAEADRLVGKRLRVNGRVAPGTLAVSGDRRSVTFRLTGHESVIPVQCSGTLPDNLKENMDVVVEGVLLADGGLRGDRVITRCASKYAPQPNPKPSHTSPAPRRDHRQNPRHRRPVASLEFG